MSINTTFRASAGGHSEHEGKRFEVVHRHGGTAGRPAYRIRVETGEVIPAWSWEVEAGGAHPGDDVPL